MDRRSIKNGLILILVFLSTADSIHAAKEREWIRNHKKAVRVGISLNNPPYQFREDDRSVGIFCDYIRLIGERTGIQFDLVPTEWTEIDDMAKQRKIDVHLTFEVPFRREWMNFSQPIFPVRWVIVTRNDSLFINNIRELKGKRISFQKNVRFYKHLLKDYPELDVLPSDTTPDGVNAVLNGKADAFIGTTITAAYYIRKQKYVHLKMFPLTEFPYEPLMIAVRNDWTELTDILNKAVASVSKQELDEIFQKWVPIQFEQSFDWQVVWRRMLGIGSVFIIILGLSVYWNRRLAKEVNERRRTEHELRKEKDKAQRYLNIAPAIMLAINENGNITLLNEQGCDILECEPDEAMGKNWFDTFLPKRVKKQTEEKFRQILRGEIKSVGNVESVVLTAKGNEKKILWHNSLLKDEMGRIVGTFSSGEDITERKRAEEALRKSEEQYRNLVENLNDVVYSANAEGIVTYVSPSIENVGGYKPDEMIGKHVSDFISPEDLPLVGERFGQLMSGKPTAYSEYRMKHKAGDIFFANISSRPIFQDGVVTGIQGIITDITAKKQAEQSLKQSEEQYRNLVENINDVVYVLDNEGNILYISPVVEKVGGYKPEELIGKNFGAFVCPEDFPLLYDRFIQILEGKAMASEYRIYHKSGKIFHARLSTHPRIINGVIAGVQGLLTDITKDKEVENALQRSNSVLKAQNEASLDAILVIDEHRKVATYNQRFAQLWNIPDDLMREMDSKRLIEHVLARLKHPDDFIQRVQYLYENKSESSREEIEFADGRIIDRYSSPIFSSENQYMGRIWFYRDISDRKLTEQALRDSEEQYRNLVENMSDVVYRLDPKGVILYISPLIESVTGFKPEEIVGRNFAEFSSPQDLPFVYEQFEKLVSDPKTLIREFRFTKKSGEIFWARTSNRPKFKDGVIQDIHGIITDITERKRAEEKISQILTEQKIILDHATVGIALLRNREFVWLNKFIENMFGYSKEELIGAKTELFYPSKESCEELGRNAYPLLSQGKIYQTERQMRRRDNSLFWCDLTGISVNSENIGEGSIWIFQDIDQKKHAEQEIIRAKEAAEAANRTKSEFLANMSHEIRTPMHAVLGFLQLTLEYRDLPKSQKKNLRIAHKSANSLLVLLNDILDLSKLESGKLELEEDTFDLEKLIRDTLRTFETKVREKGLGLSCDLWPDLSQYYGGDPVRLRQILINLIGNAVKFTEKGGIVVAVKSGGDEPVLCFSIRDTGIGIPKERMEKIFEPFTQADSSTSRRFGGTGLGTSISKQLVELMGGNIWAESAEGKGSTFHFTVRMKPADNSSPVFPPLSARDGHKADHHEVGRRLKILLAEDIEENIMLVKIRMEQRGHEVVEARNGFEAVNAYTHEVPDIVLMDVHMPGMDGIEAARQIRELETTFGKRVPIVALTASIMSEDRQTYLQAGMDDVIGKPVDFEELFAIINHMVMGDTGKPIPIISGKEAADDAPSWKNGLPGIDAKKGLQIWTDQEAYQKALTAFCRDYEYAADRLRYFIESGDRQGAHVMTHALKGVAGNLCVTDVYNTASKLNAEVKVKPLDELMDGIETLAAAMKIAADSIRQIESANKKSQEETCPDFSSKRQTDVSQLREIFAGMLESFDLYDPCGVDPFLDALGCSLSLNQLDPIRKRLDVFDFEGARNETKNLMKNLGMESV